MTNKLSESLSPKFEVCTMSDNENYNPTSEVCPKSTIRKLMSKVHNRESDVRSLTKSELFPKSEVLCMSVENLVSKNQSLKSKVGLCPKSKIRDWNQNLKSVSCLSLKPKSRVRSWKSEVESLSEVRSKFFAIIITLSYNTGIILLCVCRSIKTITGQLHR